MTMFSEIELLRLLRHARTTGIDTDRAALATAMRAVDWNPYRTFRQELAAYMNEHLRKTCGEWE